MSNRKSYQNNWRFSWTLAPIMYIAHFKSFTYAANNNIQMSTRLPFTLPHKVECTATKIFSPVFNRSALFPSEVLDYVRGMNLHKELNIDRWKSNECSSVRENEIVSLLYPILAVFVRLSEDCHMNEIALFCNIWYITYHCNLLLSRQLSQIFVLSFKSPSSKIALLPRKFKLLYAVFKSWFICTLGFI